MTSGWGWVQRVRGFACRAEVFIVEPISDEKTLTRTSLVVQWLRIRLPDAGDMGSSPGPGRSHMPQSS